MGIVLPLTPPTPKPLDAGAVAAGVAEVVKFRRKCVAPTLKTFPGLYQTQAHMDAWFSQLYRQLPADGRRYVVGFSHGTLEARRMAARGEADVLILIAPPMGGYVSYCSWLGNAIASTMLDPLSNIDPTARVDAMLSRNHGDKMNEFGMGMRPHMIRALGHDMMRNYAEGREKGVECFNFKSWEYHQEIKVPTLVVASVNDRLVPLEEPMQVIRQISTAEPMLVEGNHLAVFEAPHHIGKIADHFKVIFGEHLIERH
ncbi:MAG: alpha/beta hydrolase [Alphaproteobacteria bacterium]